MALFKYIGFVLISIGGLGSVAALGSPQVRDFIGLSSLTKATESTTSPTPTATEQVPSTPSPTLSEEDRKGQFLYKLSQKIFDSIKANTGSSQIQDIKENVIKWLKDKFSGSLENEEDKGENFKSLCEEQKPKETKSGKSVNNEYARLCFIDEGDNQKGNLWEWYGLSDESKYPLLVAIKSFVLDWSKKNVELGNSFKTKYPDANPIDKFDEWYSSSEETAKNIKNAIDQIPSFVLVEPTIE